MEQTKITNQKETLAFLSEQYPNCFFVEGKVKPLKIGIFQDLAKELQSNEDVSNRVLRQCLRHYTSSWRYLESVKEGVARVDLSGAEGDLVEKEHAEHAATQLKESKQKAKQRRAEKAKAVNRPAGEEKSNVKRAQIPRNKSPHKTSEHSKTRSSKDKGGNNNKRHQSKQSSFELNSVLTSNELIVGSKALVKLGSAPVMVTIADIDKDGVFVQLESGMSVKVKSSQLYQVDKPSNN